RVHTAENLVQGDLTRRHALQIESRHGDWWREKGRLLIQSRHDSEEERIDVELFEQRQEERHEDNRDLGPLQRPTQQANEKLSQPEKSERRESQRQNPVLDHRRAAKPGEDTSKQA